MAAFIVFWHCEFLPFILMIIYGYRHTLRICNNYRFSTAAVVGRMRLNVALCEHCHLIIARHAGWGGGVRLCVEC